LSSTLTTPTLSRELRIDVGEPVFRGHFPGMPILPGVFLIHWMRKLVEEPSPEAAPSGLSLRAVKIRFLKPVRPGDLLEMQALWKPRSHPADSKGQGYWECRAAVLGETVFTGQFIPEVLHA